MARSAEFWACVDLDEPALEAMCEGDVEFEHELLETFLSCQSDAMAEFEVALSASDYDGLRKLAHFTKGGARSIGAARLGGLAESLEMAMSRGCFDEASDLVHEVESAYARLKTIIETRFAQAA